jgi:septum formation protein
LPLPFCLSFRRRLLPFTVHCLLFTVSHMLLLASSSPRRRELLTQIGYTFSVEPADIDESRLPGETPYVLVERLARQKAAALLATHPAATVLAADTTVVLGEDVLNKPRDRDEAAEMLRRLSGRTHHVLTGIAVARAGFAAAHVETTAVVVAEIPADELARYLATGDSLDKAGAYGIQGYAARWIPRIDGDYFNVMGLPLVATVRLLKHSGWPG